jgi:methionyl-tRNA formyltransferase
MKDIVQDGDPVLRDVAQAVPEELFGSSELASLVSNMAEALDQFPEGVALAAPQIGVSLRVFIVRKDRTLPSYGSASQGEPPPESKPEVEVYVNPEIVKTSKKRAKADEGCLSIHGLYGTTKRHERVTIKARTPDGGHLQRGAGGLMAQIFEHEIDHLNGILFTDHAEHIIRIPQRKHAFAFFGTPSVASETLATLIESGFIPSIVITSTDAPKGRGLALTPSPVKTLALEYDLPVLTPEKLDTATITAIETFGCEYAVVVAYGKIFPEPLIQAFPKGVLNVHYSLLPKYRGATPLEGALLSGEKVTGVTIQKMVKELDAGDILAQKEVAIGETETAKELRPRLIEEGAQLLVAALPDFEEGRIAPKPQDHAHATSTHKLKKEDGELDLSASPQMNWNKYRAFADSIGTFFFKNGKRIKITSAAYKDGKFIVERVIPEGKKETAYTD